MASHGLFWEFPYVFTLDAIKQNNFTDGFFSFFQLKNVIHNLVYHRVYKIKKNDLYCYDETSINT